MTNIPPLNPEKTGNPIMPRKIKINVDRSALFKLRIFEASNTPNIPSDIGIGPIGMVVTEQIHKIAANIEHIAIS